MRFSLFTVIFSFISIAVFSQTNGKVKWFDEAYRPQYHFSPEENRMGSPISIVEKDSSYLLFYQWNPHNLQDGFVNWGYATSKDLLRWEFKEIALSQAEGVSDSMLQTPWWGTALRKDGSLYAWANIWGDGIYRYDRFDSGKWENPKKTDGTEDLAQSEPYVFWHSDTQKWVMIAYNRADSTMNIRNSPDGLTWEKRSSFRFKFGFASLSLLPVDNATSRSQWLLITEDGNYMLGNFDGANFKLTSPVAKFDHGRNIGGTILFNDLNNERTLMVSEIKSDQLADLPSNGQLTFPTEITLHETARGVELIRQPAREIKALYKKSISIDNKKIYPGVVNNPLQGVKGDCFHMKGTIDLGNCDVFGMIFRCNRENSGINLSYSASRGIMEIEGSRIEIKPENNKLNIELLIDRSSIELFVEGGRYVISTPIAPEMKNMRFNMYANGGEIVVDHFEVTELKSVWRKE